MNCDLHHGRLPRQALGTTLVCGKCRGRIPASAAITFEGSDYVRYFCGEDCLADWCSKTGRLQIEAARIGFLLARDGKDATLAWAKRTLGIYRRAVLDPRHFASSPHYRRLYLSSCADFRRWLATCARPRTRNSMRH